VVHDRNQSENFQNPLIECMGKAAFQASNLSLKPTRPLFNDLEEGGENRTILKNSKIP